MQKTYTPKKEQIKQTWYLVDAKDKILGRIASKVAAILRGKHKPFFSPHIDCGDYVIVINASKVRVTGRKLAQKVYRRYSGYPGGLKEVSLAKMLEKKPNKVLELAITRMLPSGPLGRKLRKKLKIYADEKHKHSAQKPILLEV